LRCSICNKKIFEISSDIPNFLKQTLDFAEFEYYTVVSAQKRSNILTEDWRYMMVFKPKRISPIPLYTQIEDDITKMITRKKLEPMDKIPPEDKLAQMYSVNRRTVSKALQNMVQKKLISRTRGKGTFVADKIKSTSSISLGIVGNTPEEEFFRGKYYTNIIEGVKKIIDEKRGVLSYQTKNNLNYQELFRNLEIVDGILIFNPFYCFKDELKKLRRRGYPCIVIGGGFFFEEGINCVDIDEIESAAMGVSALLGKGYERIGFIASRVDHLTYPSRLQGYKLALEKADVEVKDELILFHEPSSHEIECQRLYKWLKQNDLSAIFLARLPIPLKNIISMLKKVKGKNVGVALYDDFIDTPVSDLHYLAIKQPLAEIGGTATLRLLDLIARREKDTVKIRLKPELLENKNRRKLA